MKDLTLSQQYALLALDGQESIHPSVAKSAVLRAVSAARVLETELGKADADSFSEFSAELQKAVQMAKTLKKKEETQIENDMLPSYRTMKYKSPIWGYFHVQKE